MTTKELAETLGVDKRTINETIQRLLSEKVLSHLVKISVKGGYTWSFTLKTVVFQKGLAYIRNLLKDTKYIALGNENE